MAPERPVYKESKTTGIRTEYYDQHLIDPHTNTLKRAGVKGLLLRLTETGNKYFYYSCWFDGQSKRFKIGDYPDISLSEARERAREPAVMVNDGTTRRPKRSPGKRSGQKGLGSWLSDSSPSIFLPCGPLPRVLTAIGSILKFYPPSRV